MDSPLLRSSAIGAHHQHEQAREPAVGDEGLAAIDHVVIALLHGARADALEIGARAGLGHADGANELARGQARQPALLLIFRAVIEHVVRAHAVHALAEGADAAARELGVHHGLVAEVAAAAAVFGRHV